MTGKLFAKTMVDAELLLSPDEKYFCTYSNNQVWL